MTVAMADPRQYDLARRVVGEMLDGAAPNGVKPDELGTYRELYAEMVRAHGQAGTSGARKVFSQYAQRNPDVAGLRAGDRTGQQIEWSVTELLAATFPDPVWSVPGLIPAGFVVLAGRPKLGKSWLSLQIAVAVGCGGKVLGRDASRGRVLYLALEDNPRRIQDRLRKQQTPAGISVAFRFEWPALATPLGLDLLAKELQGGGYTLLVIDTISRALGAVDQMDQAAMNVTMGMLQRLAMENNVTLLAVDHHRKAAGNVGDVIDDVMGATSKVGVADAAMGLYRQRGQKEATLKITGRDVDDAELAIVFDQQLFSWQYLGTASDVRAESLQSDIIEMVGDKGGAATTKELADMLKKHPAQISRELQELVKKGKLLRSPRQGRDVPYSLPGHEQAVIRNDDHDRDD